jgi:hypothetical protein
MSGIECLTINCRQKNTDMIYRILKTEYAIQAIESQMLKVGSITELNDPSDCAPIITDLPERYDDFPNLALRNIFAQVSENLGVLSFTDAIQDPVLWSHYGDSHRGIALGFNFLDSEKIKPIQYSKEKPKISIYDIDTSIDTALTRSNVLFTKATSWKYEREFRKLIRLADCTPSSGLYFYKFPKQSLKSIVLGDRCKISKNYIYNLLKHKNYTEANVRTAMNTRHSFKITLKPCY